MKTLHRLEKQFLDMEFSRYNDLFFSSLERRIPNSLLQSRKIYYNPKSFEIYLNKILELALDEFYLSVRVIRNKEMKVEEIEHFSKTLVEKLNETFRFKEFVFTLESDKITCRHLSLVI